MKSTNPSSHIALSALALGTLLALSSAASANTTPRAARHFDLVNATFNSVVALDIRPAEGHAFQPIALGQPLRGGLASMTFDVPAGGCLRDLRVSFSGGRTPLVERIDVCRSSGLRLTAGASMAAHAGA